jgi:formamidopyrimidine-DNA glycosylase
MIELPEAVTIAAQMTKELKGKRIASALRGNAPHKFAFYNREPDEYAGLMKGKVWGESRAQGVHIFSALGNDYIFVLGGGGERIFLHANESTLPKKLPFLISFEDGMYLSVTVQMWGMLQLMEPEVIPQHPYIGRKGISPLSDDFTFAFFNGQFEALEAADPRAVKFFMISQPGVFGVGNGCLHDILYRAKIHPRRRAVELRQEERESLYVATRSTLREMTENGGRDSELDLYGCPGRYRRILGSHTAGKPCEECGAPIQKIAFLGGASYFCPRCQV